MSDLPSVAVGDYTRGGRLSFFSRFRAGWPVSANAFSPPPSRRLAAAVLWVTVSCLATAAAAQSILGEASIAGQFCSRTLWERTVTALGASPGPIRTGTVDVEFLPIFLFLLAASLVGWVAGAAWIAFRTCRPFLPVAAELGIAGWEVVAVTGRMGSGPDYRRRIGVGRSLVTAAGDTAVFCGDGAGRMVGDRSGGKPEAGSRRVEESQSQKVEKSKSRSVDRPIFKS